MEMDKIDNNELNTEIIPEIKRVTLHPLTAEGETELEVNLYPKTLLDGIVDREGKPVEVQEKLISGETIKTINGESVLGDGDIETVDAYAKEESDEKFLSKEAAAEKRNPANCIYHRLLRLYRRRVRGFGPPLPYEACEERKAILRPEPGGGEAAQG